MPEDDVPPAELLVPMVLLPPVEEAPVPLLAPPEELLLPDAMPGLHCARG